MLFLFSNLEKEGEIMLKTELLIETLGEPDIAIMGEFEQSVLFETLFERIVKLNKK